MKDLALVTWTHTDMVDIYPIYFGEMKKYFPEIAKSYVLINELSDLRTYSILGNSKILLLF